MDTYAIEVNTKSPIDTIQRVKEVDQQINTSADYKYPILV